ncbi:MAG: VOC family protein [Okeania sp. SIO2D1]|nr:VOC family protein [Okeania sp. SIO2D1]
MTKITFNHVIPQFRIFDVDKAKEFYLKFLGFELKWEYRLDEAGPVYMEVSKAGFSIHLTENHGDCCPGSSVFIWMNGIESYYQEISCRDYPFMNPQIEDASWGAQLMIVIDPFGNKIMFNESTDK